MTTIPLSRGLSDRIVRRVRIAWTSYLLIECENYVARCKREKLRTPEAIAVDERRAAELRVQLMMLECGS